MTVDQLHSEPDFIFVRNSLGMEDGPADIVFDFDLFDPRLNGPAVYTEAYMEALKRGELRLDGRTLTQADLEKSVEELLPGLSEGEQLAVISEHIAPIMEPFVEEVDPTGVPVPVDRCVPV